MWREVYKPNEGPATQAIKNLNEGKFELVFAEGTLCPLCSSVTRIDKNRTTRNPPEADANDNVDSPLWSLRSRAHASRPGGVQETSLETLLEILMPLSWLPIRPTHGPEALACWPPF